MDRFIGNKYEIIIRIKKKFKIQYGQIYRIFPLTKVYKFYNLKSNMDRFIVSMQTVA